MTPETPHRIIRPHNVGAVYLPPHLLRDPHQKKNETAVMHLVQRMITTILLAKDLRLQYRHSQEHQRIPFQFLAHRLRSCCCLRIQIAIANVLRMAFDLVIHHTRVGPATLDTTPWIA